MESIKANSEQEVATDEINTEDLVPEEEETQVAVSHRSAAAVINSEANDLVNQILVEKDPVKVENLKKQFLLVQQKKNIARVNRLTTLIEIVDDEIINRFADAPEEMSNKDIVSYMNSTQSSLNNTMQALTQTPMIQVNNQTNEIKIDNSHINLSGMDVDSRKNVLNFLLSSIRDAQAKQSEVIDVVPNEEEESDE